MPSRVPSTSKEKAPGYQNRPPMSLYYLFIREMIRLLMLMIFRIKIVRDPKLKALKEPAFIVGNHVSFADPFFAMLAMPRHRIRFVAGEEIIDKPVLRTLVRPFALIGIKPFRINFRTVITVLKSVARGISVALYPEAQRSLAGDLTPFGLSTAKLIRHLGVPTVTVVGHGAYLSWPRWRSRFLPGKVVVEAKLLFTAKEAKALSVEEIQRRMIEALGTDDYAWQSGNARPYRYFSFMRARGLHLVCHWCPSCDQPFVMASKGNTLYCTKCGQAFKVEPDGFLTAKPGSKPYFDHPLAYARWQRERTLDFLENGGALRSRVTLSFRSRFEPDEPLRPSTAERPERRGTLVIRRDSVTFDEEERDARAKDNAAAPSETLTFQLGKMPALYCSLAKYADLRSGNEMWRVFPEKSGFVTLLSEISRAFWLRGNGEQAFGG